MRKGLRNRNEAVEAVDHRLAQQGSDCSTALAFGATKDRQTLNVEAFSSGQAGAYPSFILGL